MIVKAIYEVNVPDCYEYGEDIKDFLENLSGAARFIRVVMDE